MGFTNLLARDKLNRRERLLSVPLLILLICASGLAACSSDDGAGDTSRAVLRIGIDVAPSSLDPAQASAARVVQPLAYESLIELKADGSLVPGLASEWRYLDENKGFQLKLRPDARFSDGSPVDSAAVKAWFEYFVASGGPLSKRMGEIESIDTPDDSTIELHLAAPNPSIAAVLAMNGWGSVASTDALSDPKNLATATFGAGPYVVDTARTVTGDRYVFVPNKHYYDQDRIRFEEIEVKVISSPPSMLQAMQSGQLDVAVGHRSTADAAKAAGFDVVHAPGTVQALLIGDRSGKSVPALGDVRVRQAMNMAVDRDALTHAFAGAYGAPTSEMPSLDGDRELTDHYEYDPKRAKALLREAGYANGFKLDILETPEKSDLSQAVSADLEDIGIDVKVTTANTRTDFLDAVEAREVPVVNQNLPLDYTVFQYWVSMWEASALWNFGSVEDPELATLADAGAAASDSTKYWIDMSRRATQEAHFVPLFKADNIYYVSDRVTGVELTELGGGYPFVRDWGPRG